MPYIAIDPAAAEAAPSVIYGLPESISQHPNGKSLLMMRTRLILELGARSDIPVPIWNEWINDAYQDVYASLNLPESKRSFELVTVDQQPLYLLPPTVDSVRNVSVVDPDDDTNGLDFSKIDLDSYRKLPPSCGAPEAWFREQNVLVLWPTPDQGYTLTVDVIAKPTNLSLDDHFPIVEDKWHEIILRSAKVRAWEGVQNDTKSALVENSVARQVQRKSDRDARDDESEYPAMRPVFSRHDIRRLGRSRSHVEPGE